MLATSGIWNPSLLPGAPSLSLFCVEPRSAAMDTYLRRKSMTHIWSSLQAKAPQTRVSISQQVSPSTQSN